MIKLVRVDHRLIHGQVAFSWTKFLGVDLILIPSDTIINDELRKSVIRMAKPNNVKLIIKSIDECVAAINDGQTDKYNMMILCETVDDAYKLITQVPSITALNLGGMKNDESRKQISKAVHLSESDIEKVLDLDKRGIAVDVQLVPDEAKTDVKTLL